MPLVAAALDGQLRSWPNVTTRRMFGAECYLVNGRMFAFLMKGTLVTKLPEEARAQAMAQAGARPFELTSGPFGEWTEIPLKDTSDPEVLASWAHRGYEYVQVTPPKTRARSKRR